MIKLLVRLLDYSSKLNLTLTIIMSTQCQSVLSLKRSAAHYAYIKANCVPYMYTEVYNKYYLVSKMAGAAINDDKLNSNPTYLNLFIQAKLNVERVHKLQTAAYIEIGKLKQEYERLNDEVMALADVNEGPVPVSDSDIIPQSEIDQMLEINLSAATSITMIDVNRKQQISAAWDQWCNEKEKINNKFKNSVAVDKRHRMELELEIVEKNRDAMIIAIDNVAAAKIEKVNKDALNKSYTNNEREWKPLVILSGGLNLRSAMQNTQYTADRKEAVDIITAATSTFDDLATWTSFGCSNYVGEFDKLPGAQKTALKDFLDRYEIVKDTTTKKLMLEYYNKSTAFISVDKFKEYLYDYCADLRALNRIWYVAV